VYSRELRIVETAITEILSGPFYNADQAECDEFINKLRVILKDRGVRIEDGSYSPVNVQFPATVVIHDAAANAKPPPSAGGKHLSADQVKYIREHPDLTLKTLALQFGVSENTISNVRSGKRYADI
jgi:hypothetical protein